MSLRNKLLFSFFLTTVLPILVIGAGSFQKFKNTLQENRIEELKTIADLKVTKIETFFKERKNNIQTIQRDHHIIEDLQTIVQFANHQDSPEYHSAKLSLDSHLKPVAKIYGYIDVMLVNTAGTIVYVSNPAHVNVDLGARLPPNPGGKTFENAQKGIYLSDPFQDDREGYIPAMLLAAPLHDTSGAWVGLIVFEMNMAPIYDFIQDASGLGRSGETFIGKKEGDAALFLSPLRHDKTPVLLKEIRLGSTLALPIQQAVQGGNGQGLSRDYRSKEIIAAWRYIPALDWGMVAKIDTEEAFQTVADERNFTILIGAFALMAGGGIFVLIAQSITRPVIEIQRGMAKVKAGDLRYQIQTNDHGEVAPLVHLFNEMTHEVELRTKALNDFRSAVNAAAIVSVTDTAGKILFVNDKFCEVSQYGREELIGKNSRIVSSGSHSKAFIKGMWTTISGGTIFRGHFKNKAKDGSLYWVDMTIAPFFNERGLPDQYLAIQMDITQQKRIEDQVFHLAHYDDLTGLPNRVFFKDSLCKIIKIRRLDKRPFALMFLDLDEFKLVNDTLGHPAGDQLLQEISKRLKECLREEDIVSRLGGDEFTILLPAIGKKEDVFLVARKMIESLKTPVEIGKEELFVTCSIGISLFPDDGESPEALMKNADAAMYHAKGGGPGQCSFFSSATHKMEGKTLSMTSALSHALEREELALHYQPVVDLKQGRIVGMEALIRWHREGKEMVPPGAFIPLAEKTGLILPIGAWALNTAMAQFQVWREAGFRGLTISVNVSAPQFQEDRFVENTIQIMTAHGIEQNELKLELTESILMSNQDQIITKLEQLKASGVQLSIDDFGTGFSSLSYLKRFPIHALKIDQSFVRDLPGDFEDAAITRMIIALADQLKIDVVAEGIETKAQLSYLQSQGCGLGQGYLFSRPLPKEAFTALLQSTAEHNCIHRDLFDRV